MADKPEKKSPTEPLDLQRKTEAIMSGKRPVDKLYPYMPTEYKQAIHVVFWEQAGFYPLPKIGNTVRRKISLYERR